MRVLIFHGYLLQGTGSNVYNANLAAALVREGHEVHLLCQERDPEALDWVDAAGDWDAGALRVRTRREPARATVYRPDIGGVLPVYVADTYDRVRAVPFPDLSGAELDAYLAANVAAVRDVCERVRPDVALANHLVMGPVILARALAGTQIPYAVKIHGSALEYTVKPHPRFLPYAVEGLAAARAVLTGSRHTAESLWAAMDDPDRMGPSMALAMLTTFYGLVLGTLVFGSVASRLERLSEAELAWQRKIVKRLEKLALTEACPAGKWLPRHHEAAE